jgi:hypothetical protein
VDQEPPAVKLNDALGGLLTYKLAGEDVIRSSGLPFAIVRPCALTEEPAGAPLEIDQGDVIKVGSVRTCRVLGFCMMGAGICRLGDEGACRRTVQQLFWAMFPRWVWGVEVMRLWFQLLYMTCFLCVT